MYEAFEISSGFRHNTPLGTKLTPSQTKSNFVGNSALFTGDYLQVTEEEICTNNNRQATLDLISTECLLLIEGEADLKKKNKSQKMKMPVILKCKVMFEWWSEGTLLSFSSVLRPSLSPWHVQACWPCLRRDACKWAIMLAAVRIVIPSQQMDRLSRCWSVLASTWVSSVGSVLWFNFLKVNNKIWIYRNTKSLMTLLFIVYIKRMTSYMYKMNDIVHV